MIRELDEIRQRTQSLKEKKTIGKDFTLPDSSKLRKN